MWFNKLSCNIGTSTIPASSTSYLQFRSPSSRHPQLCWVCDTLCTFKLRAAKLVAVCPATNYSEFWSFDLFCISKKKTVLHQPSRCSLRLFELTIFVDWTKCTHGFVLQSDWYHHSKAVEVDSFFRRCYETLSSPCFRGERLGTRLAAL